MSILDNILLPLVLLGRSYDEAKETAFGLLKSMSLADIAEKLPDELSYGQIQRVATARAFSTKPRVILADEPTGQLDHLSSKQLLDDLFEYIKGSDTALVIATHDLEIAERLDKKWQIHNGVLEV